MLSVVNKSRTILSRLASITLQGFIFYICKVYFIPQEKRQNRSNFVCANLEIKYVLPRGGTRGRRAQSSEAFTEQHSCHVTSGGKQSHAFPQKTIKMN